MFFILFGVKFVEFPNKSNALLSNSIKNGIKPKIESSGSLGLFYGGKCHETFPNQTLTVDNKQDWCSNIATSDDDKPWIEYSFPQQTMKLTGFSVRNGCCYYYDCCCTVESGKIIDTYCCCELYSFSLLGSNDNQTWKTIYYADESKERIRYCQYKTYEFERTESFKYIRFRFEKERPGCPKCLQINQIELYGELIVGNSYSFENDEYDESISIIGKVKRI